MIKKILIANRGEIACRIIKSCKKLGLQSIAVYSDIDRNSKHVREADESINIGGSKAQESYLLPKKIIEVSDIPRTKNGKIVELAVKSIIEGNKIKNIQALINPSILQEYKNIEELKKP